MTTEQIKAVLDRVLTWQRERQEQGGVGAERTPFGFAAIALADQRRRREDRLHAEVLAHSRGRPGVGVQLRRPELEPKVRDFCERALDPLIGAGGFDFIADIGSQVPMRAIGMLLGIPESEQEAVRDLVRARDDVHAC